MRALAAGCCALRRVLRLRRFAWRRARECHEPPRAVLRERAAAALHIVETGERLASQKAAARRCAEFGGRARASAFVCLCVSVFVSVFVDVCVERAEILMSTVSGGHRRRG